MSDVNDEKPIFVLQTVGECAEVSEFLKIGETVLMISAIDKDEPGSLNSRLVFSMDIDQPENGTTLVFASLIIHFYIKCSIHSNA